jgi:hypothetical protein
MIDGQTSEDARPWGTRMLSPPPIQAKQMTFGLVDFNTRCG